jgi:hypothetical protein
VQKQGLQVCFSTSSEVSCEATDLQGLVVVATAAHLLQHDSHQSLHGRARPAPIEEDPLTSTPCMLLCPLNEV